MKSVTKIGITWLIFAIMFVMFVGYTINQGTFVVGGILEMLAYLAGISLMFIVSPMIISSAILRRDRRIKRNNGEIHKLEHDRIGKNDSGNAIK